MGLSPSEMHDAIIKNLPGKTGKDINGWVKIARSLQAGSDKELMTKLKSEFGLGHFQAQVIVKCSKENQ